MKNILFCAVPFIKEEVTLALEAGVDGLIVPEEHKASASSLARCLVLTTADADILTLTSREVETQAVASLSQGRTVVLQQGWEIIPVENLLAHKQTDCQGAGLLALEISTPEEAELAAGILEKGVDAVVIGREQVDGVRKIVERLRVNGELLRLEEAEITEIRPVGMGHRVCVDTLSVLRRGQGLLAGNSAAFTFLVNAETERNEYVASRPFRVNAGAVHAYTVTPGDRTSYLEELRAGTEVLVVDHEGATEIAVVGRVKVEKRPMLLIRARAGSGEGSREGAVFLQNAETIRLVQAGGATVSVVDLKPGDSVLCRVDEAGRHFGMRIQEAITEE